MKHPLDIINKRLENGYYNNLPPFSYSKDAATISYLMGYFSKTDYYVSKARYEWANSKKQYISPLMIL